MSNATTTKRRRSKRCARLPGSPLAKFIRARKVSFWGHDYMVTPRLLDYVEGDGLLVIHLTALDTRPDYYVLRVDSKWGDLDDDAWHDHLDEIWDDLEDQFGQASWQDDDDEWQHDDFPAVSDSSGCAWGILTRLKQADRRTEAQIRAEMKKENT